MSSKRALLETSDERNPDRLHQRHRYAVRTIKIRNQIDLHHPSRSTKQTRSRKRKKSQILQDVGDDLLDWDNDDSDVGMDNEQSSYNSHAYSTQNYYSAIPICNTIVKAINNDDDYSLDVHLSELKLHRAQSKHYRNKQRHPHTILTHVIDRGDQNCIRVALEHIFSGNISATMIDHVCSNGRTALWYACSKGNLDLVQQLVQRGGANVNRCGVLIVAAQNGHETIVDYLLRRGCDPNRRAKNYNERALHAASRRNHINIVKALLKYGADPTILDYKQRTALDYAIHKRHNDIAQVLINHQRGHYPMSQNGFTPLMLATSRNNTSIVNILVNILPHQQVLDELALLACHYIIDGVRNKRDQAYCYFERALSMMTTPLYSSTPCAAFEFVSECQTLNELALIRENDNAMRMYALVVSERLLLERGEVNHFISLIMKQSGIYRRQGDLHRCLQLQLHAYKMAIQTDNDQKHHPKLYKKCLNAIVRDLLKMLQEKKILPVESPALIWTLTLNRRKKSFTDILFKFLCIATHLIESKLVSNKEEYILLDMVRRTLRRKFIMSDGYFIFSHCIHIFANDENYAFRLADISVSVLSVVRLLIRCGADVNETHLYSKSTPLHLISQSYNVDIASSVIRLLLDADAHIDYTDGKGHTAEECAWNPEIKELLQNSRTLSLKCRCARLINLENVCYENYLSSNLTNFVRMHNRNETSIDNQPLPVRKPLRRFCRNNFLRRYR